MGNSEALEQSVKTPSSTNTTIIGMLGVAASTAPILTVAYSPLLATCSTSTPTMHGITHGLMFLSMLFFYFLLSRHIKKRDSFVRSSIARIAFVIFGLILPGAWLTETMVGIVFPAPILCILWVLFGASAAFFTCAWTDAQNSVGEDQIRPLNLLSFALAGIMTAGFLAMTAPINVFLLIFMEVAAFFLLLFMPKDSIEEMSESEEKWFVENSKYSFNGSYILIVDGMMLGVVAGLLVARVSKGILPAALMGVSFICVALVFFLLNKIRPSFLDLGRSQQIYLPILAVGIVLSGFLDAPLNTVASIPLFIVLYLLDYTNASILTLRGSLLAISPCFCFSKGRMFIIMGQAIGWFIGAFVSSDIAHGSLPTMSVIMLLLLCFYITLSAVKPDKYAFSADENLEKHSSSDGTDIQEPIFKKPFKQKCAQVISEYDLTPREGEVLFYLAKGRNAKYSADRLFVAERTIKTHTYHIYQKMGIHSQQDLIDIVENKPSD